MSQTFSSNDFNDILDSLVLFMKNQSEFKDMNFDGSAIRELLRVLAFNAQQQAFQNNFVFNELQLDTAQLRQNVASIASRLGYVPSSKTAAKIRVNITVTPSDANSAASSLVLNKDVQFYATRDGKTFIFSPDRTYTAIKAGGKYLFNGVTLLQGIWALNGFRVQTQFGGESYIIPNGGVDTNTIELGVRDSESSGLQVMYSQFKTAYDLGPDAKLFFLRENRDGLYEFKFGDDKFAKRLSYGNVITVRYLVTQGAEGNDLSSVSAATSIGGFYDVNVEAIDQRSYGGADQESIESIRTLAPISFAASGNAVTSGDYVALAKMLFPETYDAICWGGESNVPPRYGYVFLSVIPKHSESLSALQKDDLSNILKKYNVGSVTPIIVDPTFTYVNVQTTIKCNPNLLTLTTPALSTKIDDYCRVYSKEKMERFGGSLEMSRFSEFLDSIDYAITGNYTQVSYEKRFIPTLNTSGSYIIDFSHKISNGSVQVVGFRVSDADNNGWTYSIYDSDGVLKLKKTNESSVVELQDNLGTVDYVNGVVKISNFNPNYMTDTYLKVLAYCSPSDDQSLTGIRNSILKFNDIDINLTMVTK